MVSQASNERVIHQGRNIKRIREILGIKQDVLANTLGLTQQAISQLEQKEALDQEMLERVAKALKVPLEAINNFDEQAVVNIFSNTFNDNAALNSNCNLNFNSLEKVVELYERLLKEKDDAIVELRNKLSGAS